MLAYVTFDEIPEHNTEIERWFKHAWMSLYLLFGIVWNYIVNNC